MKRKLSFLKTTVILLNLVALLGAAEPLVAPYEADGFSVSEGQIDRLVFAALRKQGFEPARPCSDEVFVRRVFLDTIGMLPEAKEVESFLRDKQRDKRARLIDDLLARDAYADYWTMRWCDLLRVKSEFPINLWPNAVQAYQRWIHEALQTNMPYDDMARALLTSSGSNFRVAPVNFFRAVQGEGPQPISAAVVLTFMGSRIETWPADRRAGMETLFSRVHFKPTAEWKEEIVCLDPAPLGSLKTVLPDGRMVDISPGSDPRVTFANWLMSAENPWFAKAAVNRAWAWVFGRGVVHEPDDLRPDNPPSVPGLLEYLAKDFVAKGYDQKQLLRLILNSRVYQLSSIPRSTDTQAVEMFASYPVRRLEAEILLDALCCVTGTVEGYDSPIPEPFTYIPASARSVNLADGSITSSFLEMFGRSNRDTGMVMERNNRISEAQLLYLLNSTQLQMKIAKSWRLRQLMQAHQKDAVGLIRAMWIALLSRPPQPEELRFVLNTLGDNKQAAKQAAEDLAWALINSKEFLYRH